MSDDIEPGVEPASMIPPGHYWNGVEVVASPSFELLPGMNRPMRPSREERLFNTFMYAAEKIDRQGMPVTVETLHAENGDIPQKLWGELLQTDKVRAGLEDRGIRLPSETGLSPDQLSALAIYMDTTSKLSHAQRLKAAGVTDAKWRGWNRQREFAEYLSGTAEGLLRDSQPMMLQRVTEAIDGGERWAIELGLEMTGRHDRRNTGVDPAQVILAIFMVLDDEGVPTATMGRIAARVKQMMGQQAPQIVPAQLAVSTLSQEAVS